MGDKDTVTADELGAVLTEQAHNLLGVFVAEEFLVAALKGRDSLFTYFL